jgi:transcriptional regulator with XRE-family HTH domain
MLSLIERGESSPTAVVLEKLATGLGVTLASLFVAPAATGDPVSRRAQQQSWRDPHSGYVRRNLSPTGVASPIQLVEVEFPPGGRVAYDTAAREPQVHQQFWVLDGVIDITYGEELFRLEAGDCFAMVLDRPMAFHNPTGSVTRYAVAITTTTTTTHFRS